MKKRIVAVLMLAVMLVSMVAMAGCQNKKNADNSFVVPENGFDTNAEVTITFTHTMGAKLQDVLNTYIAEFNKIYPNIHIEHKSAGGWGDINGQINTATPTTWLCTISLSLS